jgi:hypothetical protein
MKSLASLTVSALLIGSTSLALAQDTTPVTNPGGNPGMGGRTPQDP